jgi:hypothetical protein
MLYRYPLVSVRKLWTPSTHLLGLGIARHSGHINARPVLHEPLYPWLEGGMVDDEVLAGIGDGMIDFL